MYADLARLFIDVGDENILDCGNEIGLFFAFDLIELVGGVGEHVHHRADVGVGEVVVHGHTHDLRVEMLARLELYLCAANGEHLALERDGSVHIVDLGELHKNHLALYALARGAEGLAVHIKCAEAAQLPCAHVPGLNLDLAAHAVRVDDLSDFNIFRARARLRRALFGKETHVSFSFAYSLSYRKLFCIFNRN